MTNSEVERPIITVIDYQAGNIRSVEKALEKSGASVKVSGKASDLEKSDAVVFPGQGSCDSSMVNLRNQGLDEVLVEWINSGKPFMGVCLGLQLLLEESDEGDERGLGVLEGRVEKLPEGQKVPHMGWNSVRFTTDHPVFKGVSQNSYFYFVHSYIAVPKASSIIAGHTEYGRDFCSAVAFDNVVAVQFHPEKSGENGLNIYKNFVSYVESSS
ncbi:MAG: imidazole glycerol phosphate synthase subunit HisH [SAR202 cluster bacterium]|jgi:glutamine amidotransferase|nr:imidazole glycerol phosphate synthase subunit HisH [SAR202 cluster bacterium]|tara:strand:- start:8164 stop:8802 length:639 start_codon:yes stop_codon:yes gene_type:complete